MWKFLLIVAVTVHLNGAVPRPTIGKGESASGPLTSELKERVLQLATELLKRNDINEPSVIEQPSVVSSEVASSEVSSSQEATVAAPLKAQFPDLFETLGENLESGERVAEAMTFGISKMVEGQGYANCMHLAQLIGGIRFSLAHEFVPGMFETLRVILEQIKMETGAFSEMTVNEEVVAKLQHALYEPLYTTMQRLECELGIVSCPSSATASNEDVSLETRTAPTLERGLYGETIVKPKENTLAFNPTTSSPLQQLYLNIKDTMMNANFQTTSVGDIVVRVVEDVLEPFVETYGPRMRDVCADEVVTGAPEAIKKAIEQVEDSMEYYALLSKIYLVYPEPTLAKVITGTLIQEHFVDRYLGLALLKDLVKNAQIMGVDKAVTDIDGHILSLMYEMSEGMNLYIPIYLDLSRSIPEETLNAPIYKQDLYPMINTMGVLIESIVKRWDSPCMNARMMGLVAGLTEVFRFEAITDPRVQGLRRSIVERLGLSISDRRVRKAFEDILSESVHAAIDPLVKEINDKAGRQPTEVSFMLLEEKLSNKEARFETVGDLIEVAMETLLPLLGRFHDKNSNIKCDVSNADLLSIVDVTKAPMNQLTNINRDDMVSKIQSILTPLLAAESPIAASNEQQVSAIADKQLTAMAEYAADTIRSVIVEKVKVMESLKDGVNGENAMAKLVDILKLSYGNFVYSIMQNHPDGKERIVLNCDLLE